MQHSRFMCARQLGECMHHHAHVVLGAVPFPAGHHEILLLLLLLLVVVLVVVLSISAAWARRECAVCWTRDALLASQTKQAMKVCYGAICHWWLTHPVVADSTTPCASELHRTCSLSASPVCLPSVPELRP